MRIVINTCFGGFGLSDAAYEKLIEYGVPVQKYIEQKRDPETNLYLDEPANDGEVIFDREMTPEGEDDLNDMYYKYPNSRMNSRYWEVWIGEARSHPLLIRVIEELGGKANGGCAALKIVEIPDGTDYEISEYDGSEHIAEKHRTWS